MLNRAITGAEALAVPHEREFDYSRCPTCGAHDWADWGGNEYCDGDGYNQDVRCESCGTEFRLFHEAVPVEMRIDDEDKIMSPWPAAGSMADEMVEFSAECNMTSYTDTDKVWDLLSRWYTELTGRNLEEDTEARVARAEREEL